MARIPYPSAKSLVDEPMLDLVADQGMSVRNSTRLFAHNPGLLTSYRRFGNELRRQIRLDKRDQELLLLVVAAELNSPYMWYNHVDEGISRGLGVTQDEIEAIEAGDLDSFGGRDRALLQYARRMANNAVDDPTHERLTAHVDAPVVVDVAITVGYFVLVATVYNALDIDTEERA